MQNANLLAFISASILIVGYILGFPTGFLYYDYKLNRVPKVICATTTPKIATSTPGVTATSTNATSTINY